MGGHSLFCLATLDERLEFSCRLCLAGTAASSSSRLTALTLATGRGSASSSSAGAAPNCSGATGGGRLKKEAGQNSDVAYSTPGGGVKHIDCTYRRAAPVDTAQRAGAELRA